MRYDCFSAFYRYYLGEPPNRGTGTMLAIGHELKYSLAALRGTVSYLPFLLAFLLL